MDVGLPDGHSWADDGPGWYFPTPGHHPLGAGDFTSARIRNKELYNLYFVFLIWIFLFALATHKQSLTSYCCLPRSLVTAWWAWSLCRGRAGPSWSRPPGRWSRCLGRGGRNWWRCPPWRGLPLLLGVSMVCSLCSSLLQWPPPAPSWPTHAPSWPTLLLLDPLLNFPSFPPRQNYGTKSKPTSNFCSIW